MSLILLITLFALGKYFRWSEVFDERSSQTINAIIIHISLPALILAKVPTLVAKGEVSFYWVAIPWITLLLTVFCVVGLARLFCLPQALTGVLLLLAPLGNTSFIGIPMIQSLIGSSGVPIAIIYDQLTSFLALCLYGSAVVALYGEQTFQLKNVAVKMLSFPPFWSLFIAVIASKIPLYNSLKPIFDDLSLTLFPLALLSVGSQFSVKLVKEKQKALFVGLTIKLLLMPSIALLTCLGVGWFNEESVVVVLESAMAPMISAGILGAAAKFDQELISAMVGWGLIVSLGSVFLWHLSLKLVLL